MAIPEGNLQLIAMAAARLLTQKGAGAVTHRAVAAEAGLTLGVVSHNCKRTGDLLKLAYSEIYVQLTGGLPDRPGANPQVPDKGAQPDLSRMLAIDELVLAVARGRVGEELIGLLRYLRGTTSVHTVRERVKCTEAQSVALAAVYSSIAMGYWRSAGQGPDADAGARYDRFLDALFAAYA
jgi:AcrR family transcriptional regulator